MEKTHNIEAILSSLSTNRVSILINENEYVETVAAMYKQRSDPFADMDDLVSEYKLLKTSLKGRSGHECRPKATGQPKQPLKTTAQSAMSSSHRSHENPQLPSQIPLQIQTVDATLTEFQKMLYCMYLVKENALHEFLCHRKTQNEVDNALQAFKTYIQASINCLNPNTKSEYSQKYSKKKLQAILANILKSGEPVRIEPDNEDLMTMLAFIADCVKCNFVFRLANQQEWFVCIKPEFPVTIVKVDALKPFPVLIETTTVERYKNLKQEDTIRRLKADVTLLENLKSLSVKDLRQLAVDIGIQLEDSRTNKLLSKVELRQQVESKLKDQQSV